MGSLGLVFNLLEDWPAWAQWAFFAALLAFFVFVGFAAADTARQNQEQWHRFESYMRQCVPKQSEQRCRELWRWVEN